MRYRSATVADSHGLPRCLGGEKERRTSRPQRLPRVQATHFTAQILRTPSSRRLKLLSGNVAAIGKLCLFGFPSRILRTADSKIPIRAI